MRMLLATVLTTAAVTCGLESVPSAAVALTCGGDDVSARRRRWADCLGAREFCARHRQATYRRYGFVWVLYPSGYRHPRRQPWPSRRARRAPRSRTFATRCLKKRNPSAPRRALMDKGATGAPSIREF
jgi:hypothetical protein